MDARLAAQVEGVLHLVERRRNTGLFHPLVDEHQKFVLLARQHGGPVSRIGTKTERTCIRSSYVLQHRGKYRVSSASRDQLQLSGITSTISPGGTPGESSGTTMSASASASDVEWLESVSKIGVTCR